MSLRRPEAFFVVLTRRDWCVIVRRGDTRNWPTNY